MDLGVGFEAGQKVFDNKRPTLVMIHGAGGSTQIWRNQVHLLKCFANTLALDLPGHGRSHGASRSEVDAYATWLGHTLRTIFQKPVILMGHSMGGAVVQAVAHTWPQLLQGLILAATGPRLPVAPFLLEGLHDDFPKTIDTIIGYAFGPDAPPSAVSAGAQLMKSAGWKVVRDDFLACDGFDRTNALAEIHLPCLIVCGEQDNLTPPRLSAGLHASISGSRLQIIPASGHMVMIEKFEAFNRVVADFISETG
jgi:pimeloyl-ACP methyl ester carboxylesterase